MSIEMTIVFKPLSAHFTAVAEATVVLPTPPFPEKMIIRGLPAVNFVSWSDVPHVRVA